MPATGTVPAPADTRKPYDPRDPYAIAGEAHRLARHAAIAAKVPGNAIRVLGAVLVLTASYSRVSWECSTAELAELAGLEGSTAGYTVRRSLQLLEAAGALELAPSLRHGYRLIALPDPRRSFQMLEGNAEGTDVRKWGPGTPHGGVPGPHMASRLNWSRRTEEDQGRLVPPPAREAPAPVREAPPPQTSGLEDRTTAPGAADVPADDALLALEAIAPVLELQPHGPLTRRQRARVLSAHLENPLGLQAVAVRVRREHRAAPFASPVAVLLRRLQDADHLRDRLEYSPPELEAPADVDPAELEQVRATLEAAFPSLSALPGPPVQAASEPLRPASTSIEAANPYAVSGAEGPTLDRAELGRRAALELERRRRA